MKIGTKLLMGALLMTCGTSCYVTRFTYRTPQNAAVVTSNDYDGRWHHDGVFGLVEFSEPVRLDEVCPGGVASIEQRTTFINGFVSMVTRDLYSPQTVTIECVSGQRGEAVLNPEGNAAAYMPVPPPPPPPSGADTGK